jgi:two-component system CheB/CheR fusion protein
VKAGSPQDPGQDFTRLLGYLKTARGFDFSGYKLSSLIRRVQKRMQGVGVADYAGYIDYLEVHPDEFAPLFNTVLINVTSFFRDAPSWQALAEHALPRMLEGKGDRTGRCTCAPAREGGCGPWR